MDNPWTRLILNELSIMLDEKLAMLCDYLEERLHVEFIQREEQYSMICGFCGLEGHVQKFCWDWLSACEEQQRQIEYLDIQQEYDQFTQDAYPENDSHQVYNHHYN